MNELQRIQAHASIRTMLGAVKEANEFAKIKNFKFISLEEWKKFLGSFVAEDYPCHFAEPWKSEMVWLKGRIKTRIPMNGWILRSIPEERTEWTHEAIESEYLEPMRKLAKHFFTNLLDATIIDQEQDAVNITVEPEYAFLSENLFGISYQARINIIEQVY